MTTTHITVTGMTCGHCVNHVTTALKGLGGVTNVDIELEGGKVTIGIANATLDGSGPNAVPAGDYVALSVSDTGTGMPAEVLNRAFEPFFTTKFTGRGLGLAAVLGIVRGHHGALRVSSELGKGTTFKLLLPATPDAAVAAQTPMPQTKTWRGSGRVLLADDEETVRAVVSRSLENLGFTVTTAADGREAAQLFEAEPEAFTLVVLDFTMPHMNGAEAFARMQQIRPTVRVLLMSGFNEPQATLNLAGKGLAGFLPKPFELPQFCDVIRAVFEAPAP